MGDGAPQNAFALNSIPAMTSPAPSTVLLGKFEPADSKRLLEALEARGIAFEIAADHSELLRPGRTVEMILGTFPDGSKMAVFVKESDLAAAQNVMRQVFPEFEAVVPPSPSVPYKPNHASTVSPYLVVEGAEKTLTFLRNVFGADVVQQVRDDGDRTRHAEVRIEDSVIMLADAMPNWPAVPAHVHVYVRDVDETYRRALEAGATSVQAPVKKEDTDKRGGVKDAGGTTWWIATQVG